MFNSDVDDLTMDDVEVLAETIRDDAICEAVCRIADRDNDEHVERYRELSGDLVGSILGADDRGSRVELYEVGIYGMLVQSGELNPITGLVDADVVADEFEELFDGEL